ncbi:MAG: hypothetical protein AB8G22_12110 [Saprospiraceae bacterium]
MAFISENTIDQITVELENSDAKFEEALIRIEEEQPHILAYLFNENFDVLTNSEKDYLLFLAITIWKSTKKEVGTIALVNENTIGSAEEQNWEFMTAAKGKTFRDRLDIFFNNTPQEDLLAFVEDALTLDDEEDRTVTKEGREPMFVALKTVIDVITKTDS